MITVDITNATLSIERAMNANIAIAAFPQAFFLAYASNPGASVDILATLSNGRALQANVTVGNDIAGFLTTSAFAANIGVSNDITNANLEVTRALQGNVDVDTTITANLSTENALVSNVDVSATPDGNLTVGGLSFVANVDVSATPGATNLGIGNLVSNVGVAVDPALGNIGIGALVSDVGVSATPAGTLTAGAWTPAQLPNLFMWYDFDDVGTLTLNGSVITGVANKASGGPALSAPVGNGPTRVTNAQNGRAVAQYTAASRYLRNASTTPTVDHTSFCVFVNTSRPAQCFIYQYEGRQIFLITNGSGNLELFTVNASSNEEFIFSSIATTLNTWTVCGVSDSSTTQTKLIKDGTATTFTHIDRRTGGTGFTLGNGGSSSNALFGSIGEYVETTSELSQTDRERLEGYLAHRWGTTGALPGAHPFKTNPP